MRERWLESTRGRIVAMLRRKSRTVAELAEALRLTDNAVRAHLVGLERDGLVRQDGYFKGSRKPFHAYAVTPQAEQLFPRSYGTLLREALTVMLERHGRDEVESLLREVGRRMAASHRERLHRLPMAGRMEEALGILADLGGLAELEDENGQLFLQGYSCPFAEALPGNPEICAVAEEFLATILGCRVVDRCSKGEPPRCRFQIEAVPPG